MAAFGGQNRPNPHILSQNRARILCFLAMVHMNHMKLYNALYGITGRYEVWIETPRMATVSPQTETPCSQTGLTNVMYIVCKLVLSNLFFSCIIMLVFDLPHCHIVYVGIPLEIVWKSLIEITICVDFSNLYIVKGFFLCLSCLYIILIDFVLGGKNVKSLWFDRMGILFWLEFIH